MPNRPVELFAILKWLQPSKWDYWQYVHQFCDAKRGYGNSLDVSGSSNLNQLFALLTKGPDAVMLRMRKQDVLKQLPDKMHQIIRLPAPEKCKALIDEETKLWTVRKEALDHLRKAREDASTGNVEAYRQDASTLNNRQSVAMAEMAKIRQQLSVAKAPLCIQFAKDLLNGGTDKLLMFGHHRTGLEIVAEGLKDYGAQLLYGGGDPMKRQEMVKKFQTDKEARVMVIGTQAGGVGLNLTAASRVIMMESQWNDAGNDQASDRCHRIGQKESVLVTWLVFDGSVDSRVLQTCLKKTSISEAAIDGIVPVQQGEPKPDKPKTDWKAIGKAMTESDRKAAQDAIRFIAKLDSDAARNHNGLGFSKIDSELGRQLACLIAPSEGQYAVMRHMALKYRGQLPADLRIRLLGNQIKTL
jgi:SWI/SNF-related matrix-associated actin-dependent regulator 1 of chromatin subfamily A